MHRLVFASIGAEEDRHSENIEHFVKLLNMLNRQLRKKNISVFVELLERKTWWFSVKFEELWNILLRQYCPHMQTKNTQTHISIIELQATWIGSVYEQWRSSYEGERRKRNPKPNTECILFMFRWKVWAVWLFAFFLSLAFAHEISPQLPFIHIMHIFLAILDLVAAVYIGVCVCCLIEKLCTKSKALK